MSQNRRPDPSTLPLLDPVPREDPALDDDTALQRHNAQLPPAYRATLAREKLLMHRALLYLINCILTSPQVNPPSDSDQPPTSSAPPEKPVDAVDGYEHSFERDYAALEKGLGRFLDLKHPFDPDDYPLIVRVLMRGAFSKSLDMGLRSKLARCAVRFLHKRQCQLPEGLPWRPIVKVILAVHIDCVTGGPFIGRDIRDAHCRNLLAMLSSCRMYPSPTDGPESIWQHFAPKLVGSDINSRFQHLLFLSHILPIRGKVWAGWVDEGMQLWRSIESSSDWDAIWMTFMCRAARQHPHVHDWTPHLPYVYTRLTKSLDLPLGAIAPQSAVDMRCPHFCNFLLDVKMVPAAAGFIVHSMDPKNDVSWDFFERLIALIANYFHPSNTGRWSVTTCSFLVHTIAHFVSRVTSERRAEKAGLSERIFGSKTQSAVAAAEHRLSRDFVNRVVNLLLPLMQQALHSKYGSVSVQAAGAARDLAILSPEIVIEPCLVQAAEGLQSISSPHRTSAALRLLSSLTPVFMDPSFFPNGVDFLPQILMLTLPGIDANDLSKTDATFKFIASAAGRLQSIIASDPGCAVAHFLEDYVFQLLERVFALLESLEAPPKKNRNGHFPSGGGSPVSFFIFSVSMENLLGALPRDLTVTVAQRISKQVRGAAVSNAIKFYALLVRTAAAAAAEAKSGCSANIFIPQLLDLILEKSSDSTDEQYTLTSVGENELVWRIRMLAQASRTCGRMLQFKEKISTVIRLAMDKPSRPIYKAGGRLLRGFLEGLSCTRMKFGPGLGTEEDAVTDGGIYSFQWKEPSKEEWAGAEDFVEYFLNQAEKLCYEGSKGLKEPEVTNDRDVLFRALRMLHAIQRGGRWIFAGAIPDRLKELDRFADAAISMSKQDAKMILKRPVSAGLGGERVESGGREIATKLWSRTYLLVSEIMAMVIATRPDDGALLYRTLEPLELAHEPFRKASPTRQPLHICTAYKSIYTSVVASKRPFGAEGGPGRDMPRFIVKLRVEAHHELRLSIAARGGLTADSLNDTLISQVAGLAINDFPRVRGEARGVLTRAMRFAKPAVRRREIQRIIAVLKESAISVTASSGLASELGDITSPSSTRGVAMQSEDPRKPGEMPSTTTQRLAQSASGAKNGDILYDRMIGAAAVLRSAAAAPIIMRSWDLFISILKALLDAMLSAERADAASAVSYLFSKLASLVRPLSLTPIRVVREDFSATADETYTAPERDEEKRRTMLYDDLNKYLLGVLNRTTESLKKDKEQEQSHGAGSELSKTKEAHWRLQSLVATILYIILREDRPPPASVAEFFIKGMASDVVTLRQISSKAIMFILAVHGRRDGVKRTEDASFDDSPTSWRTAGNLALGAIGEVVCEPQFAKKLVHTLALDHDDSEGGSRRNQMIGNAGGAIAVMNISRNIDGDACWMMAGGRPWPSSWVPRSRDNMNIVRMRLYESFVRVFGRYIFDALAPTLSDLIAKLEAKQEIIISGVKPEDVRVLAAEMLAGICRGLDIYHCEDGVPEEKLQSLAFALLSDMTGRLGNVTGGTLIRLIATSESHTVGCGVWASILEWLLKKKPVVVPMGDGPVAHLQARRLRYLHACVADIDESKGDITSRFVKETLGPLTSEIGFDHQLKTVREEVARCLSLIASIVPKQAEIFFDDKITELFGRMSPGAMTDVAGPDSSSIEDAQKKSRSRQGETLSRFISIVQWGGRTTAFERYVPKALPALFASFDESDSERISHARMALSFCAQGRFLSSTIREVIVAVEETVNDPRWKVRSSVLAFLQVFSFVSLFRISPNAMQHIRQIVLTLLADSQLEVRQAAAAVFVTMVRDATTEAVEEVRNSRMKVLESTTPKRRGSKREPLDSETVRERHGAVLGLSSMITSNPYSVPQWMPAVLVALSSCVNDPPPISTGVRKLFADFMRTHRDEWSTHKLAFAPDELDIVSEVLVSPSYYA